MKITVEFLENTLNSAGAAAAAHADVECVLMFGHFELSGGELLRGVYREGCAFDHRRR